jgi:hypothetical protein
MAIPYQCDHGNDAPVEVLTNLPKSQGGTARHKCATCAYSEGRNAALGAQAIPGEVETCPHGNSAPKLVLVLLPDTQAGVEIQRHKCCVCAYAAGFNETAIFKDFKYPDEISDSEALTEGNGKTVTVNVYERSPLARLRCIEHYGYACTVCGMNFEAHYGPVGKGLIHVHHLQPLASAVKPHEVDPVKDLRPVCPNCHAMLHRKTPPFTIHELREMLAQHKEGAQAAEI